MSIERDEGLLDPVSSRGEVRFDLALRPTRLDEYIGQEAMKTQMVRQQLGSEGLESGFHEVPEGSQPTNEYLVRCRFPSSVRGCFTLICDAVYSSGLRPSLEISAILDHSEL